MQQHLRLDDYKNIALTIALSWMYAACAQVALWLPFGLVPIYLHPMPLFASVVLFKRKAVYAWALYIVQGAMGLPFFAGYNFGLMYLFGPTGGYIFGMLIASIFLCCSKKSFINICMANLIIYAFGLAQLSLFVPSNKLLYVGLFPFLFGGLIKSVFVAIVAKNS